MFSGSKGRFHLVERLFQLFVSIRVCMQVLAQDVKCSSYWGLWAKY